MVARQGCHVSAGQIFKDDIVKSGARQIYGSAMAQTVYYMRMPNAIERHGFILKISY
jgi:hypothetical protein